MATLTILLLSGGGHTGSNVMGSLASRRSCLRLVATSDRPDEPALFNFDAAYLAPRLTEDAGGFERRVLEIIEREIPDLVIPCRDEDVQWLADLGERRPDLAAKFLCGGRRAAGIANDKWLSHEFCRDHALPFAPTLLCDPAHDGAGFVGKHGLPLVAKPRHGVASAGVMILTNLDQVARAMQRPQYILQKYLGEPGLVHEYLDKVNHDGVPLFHSFQGAARSLLALVSPDGGTAYVNSIEIKWTGRNARSKSIDHDVHAREIGTRCAAAFAAAGWRGPLNIQCQSAADGTLMIHEFNARFPGGMVARLHLGYDEVGAAIRAFTGHDIGRAASGVQTPAEVQERIAPRAADPRNVRTLSQYGEWSRELE